MEQYSNEIFEDVRHERSVILLLSLTDPNILKQSKFTDHEIDIIKNIALEILKETTNIERAYCHGSIRKKIF